MLIAGEKWACEACVRGHRVSNCQHADRPLQHINKKGRPVSQCPHCRGLRKSRSAHARCECGEKTHTKASCGQDGEAQEHSCCCCHGARCTCALKKEHTLDPVPESENEAICVPSAPRRAGRPRAATTQSDGSVTKLFNGHHKPIHKHNTMAHKCGLPYVLPRSYSVHGAASLGLANRSADSSAPTGMNTSSQQSPLPCASSFTALPDQRLVKSEQASPIMGAMMPSDMSSIPPLDLSILAADLSFLPPLDNPPMAEHELPLFSAGLSNASVDWSHYDGLEFHNDNLGPAYSQPPSWFDFGSTDQPGLTSNSTSGEQSEVDDGGIALGYPNAPSVMSSQDFGLDDYAPEVGMVGLALPSGPVYNNTVGNQDDLDEIDKFLREAAAANQTVLSDGTVLSAGTVGSTEHLSKGVNGMEVGDAPTMWAHAGVYRGHQHQMGGNWSQ